MSNGRTAVIMVAGLAIGIVAAVLAGQWIFDGVFGVLHPDTRFLAESSYSGNCYNSNSDCWHSRI